MDYIQKCALMLALIASLHAGTAESCSYTGIMACSIPLEAILMDNSADSSDLNKICPVMREVVDCFNDATAMCPTSMRSTIEAAKSSFTQLMEMCQAPEGGASLCTADDVLECVNPLINMTMTDSENFDAVCAANLKAIDCLEEEVDTCPEYMQSLVQTQMNDLSVSKSLCTYQGENPNLNSTCSVQRIMDCNSHLNASGSAMETNMKEACPQYIKTADCLATELEMCPDTLKMQLKDTMEAMAETKGYCQAILSGNHTDGGSNPDGSGGDNNACSQYDIMGCMAGMMNVSPADRRNLDVLCPITKDSLKCLESKWLNCPDAVKPALAPIMVQVREGKKLCDDKWNSKATGLQSSVMLTLMTAMMALVRHFP